MVTSSCSSGRRARPHHDVLHMVVAPDQERSTVAARERRSGMERFRRAPSRRGVLLILIGIAALSSLLRVALVAGVQAPVVFSDELGYAKLARTIGLTGRLGLFNERGLSYSPLYSVVLSPIFALGASAPTAYTLMK